MTCNQKNVSPGPNGSLFDANGNYVKPPNGWSFLPAGDAGLTRKVTAQGNFWRVQFKKGRRLMSKGIWAPSDTIIAAQNEVKAMRSTDAYAQKRQYELKRRANKQEAYKKEFLSAVEGFLSFHESYKSIEKVMAYAVTIHAIPVGSGTVARTEMIPLEERAAKAVIAWMRHQTTAYDQLHIPRIKGERRAVRKQLAQQSLMLLESYRNGHELKATCPLLKALKKVIDQHHK